MKNKLLKGKSVYITSVGVASPLILQLPRDVKNLQNLLYTLKYHLPLYTLTVIMLSFDRSLTGTSSSLSSSVVVAGNSITSENWSSSPSLNNSPEVDTL